MNSPNWTQHEAAALAELLRLAKAEDFPQEDLTSAALVPSDAMGQAKLVAREDGIFAGEPAAAACLALVDESLSWQSIVEDGTNIAAGQVLGEISGPARAMLTAERTLLNTLCHLSGVATATHAFVQAVRHTKAKIYDTRKTLPGWRILDKYAVRAGGGFNQRLGLSDGVIIKDNHLAFGATADQRYSPAEAVAHARSYCPAGTTIEVEVDTLEQLRDVLPAKPDYVLLDNMTPETLREAVELRDSLAPGIELEASGGVNLSTVRAIAASGVERISIGALTHSARALDLGLDWVLEP